MSETYTRSDLREQECSPAGGTKQGKKVPFRRITPIRPLAGNQMCATPFISWGNADPDVVITGAQIFLGGGAPPIPGAVIPPMAANFPPGAMWAFDFGAAVPCGIPLALVVTGMDAYGTVQDITPFECNCP
jgi:hypothetical protein